MNETPHTSRVFEDDLNELRATICEMGGLAELAISRSVAAVLAGDEDAADEVLDRDRNIDLLGERIEQQALRLIALRAPLADDLKDVLGAFKIAGLLARIGDCAKSIARRTRAISEHRDVQHVGGITRMTQHVTEMLKLSLDAFATRNSLAAAQVPGMDTAVDQYHANLFRAFIDQMIGDPRTIVTGTHFLFICQKLERIGDHASGIAEVVQFAAHGSQMAAERQDGPTSNAPVFG